MSDPIGTLQKYLTPKSRPKTGVIVGKLTGNVITVRTSRGIVEAVPVDSTLYRVGDSVRIQDNLVIGKLRPESSIPTFYV